MKMYCLCSVSIGLLFIVSSVGAVQRCFYDRQCGDGLQGHTRNPGTGPNAGPSGTSTDEYLYLDSNDSSAVSEVRTPNLVLPLGGTVEFSYHMFGLVVGSLRVEATIEGQPSQIVWVMSGQQHTSHNDSWTRELVAVPANTRMVSWVATHFRVGGHSDLAVDDITIIPVTGATLSPTSQPTDSPTAGGRAFSCQFDSPVEGNPDTLFLCGMNATNRWFTNVGRTGSSGTGPLFGQTGVADDRYVYLESSDNRGASGVSNLTTPIFALPVGGHVSFYYHMYGAGTGTLSLQARDNTASPFNTIFNLSGQQHYDKVYPWTLAAVDLPVGTVQLQWVGTFLNFTGDMALDNIVVERGPSPPTPPAMDSPLLPVSPVVPSSVVPPGEVFRCDFTARSLCAMLPTGSWVAVFGGPSPNAATQTGPQSGLTGAFNDGYVLADSTPGVSTSNLTTPMLTLPENGYVSFFYHMHGSSIGSLSVERCVSSTECATVWSLADEQHASPSTPWGAAAVPISAGTVLVRFIASYNVNTGGNCGEGGGGDIALDAITISVGSAPPTPPTPPPTPDSAVQTRTSLAPVAPQNTIYSCTFSNATNVTSVCGLNFTGRWQVNAGGATDSLDTGPADGEGGLSDAYVFLEASVGAGGNALVSYLTTPQLALGGPAILSFYFHMYGASVGNLTVEAQQSNGTFIPLWTRSGWQHCASEQEWTGAVVVLPINTTFVRWVGTHSGSFTGDIAIDTVTIARGTLAPTLPTPTPTSAPTVSPSIPSNTTSEAPTPQTGSGQHVSCSFSDGASDLCGFTLTGGWRLNVNRFCSSGECARCTGCNALDFSCGEWCFGLTATPTATPTALPTAAPTMRPTSYPTSAPTMHPTISTTTAAPTSSPTASPSFIPTPTPSLQPTSAPSSIPTMDPTMMPSGGPTVPPTSAPSTQPTSVPTAIPTVNSTMNVSAIAIDDGDRNVSEAGVIAIVIIVLLMLVALAGFVYYQRQQRNLRRDLTPATPKFMGVTKAATHSLAATTMRESPHATAAAATIRFTPPPEDIDVDDVPDVDAYSLAEYEYFYTSGSLANGPDVSANGQSSRISAAGHGPGASRSTEM